MRWAATELAMLLLQGLSWLYILCLLCVGCGVDVVDYVFCCSVIVC